MRLVFLGTRGYIDGRNARHNMHAALLIEQAGSRVMLDAGQDWKGHLDKVGPDAIVVTHAHPDHAWALESGAPCPVYATGPSWEAMSNYAIRERRVVEPRKSFDVGEVRFEAFPVDHSVRAPAVGYRITSGDVTLFYVPDVVYIPNRGEALGGADLYIGDGSTVEQSFVRKSDGVLIGHTPVRTQLTWCQKEGVSRAIITHCGPDIVEGDEERALTRIRHFAEERGVEVEVAYDGMEVTLGG